MPDIPHQKIIAIVGPTSSGKTSLSITLAKKYNGAVVSADSRQVYRGMDIGTGKVTKREMRGVPHYLLDVASPKRTFSAATYRQKARKAVGAIARSGKLPIICGGTGFYVDALLSRTFLPDVKPNPTLRKKWDAMETKDLFAMLTQKDPRRAARIDPHNKRRLVRALEIIATTGKPVPLASSALETDYRILFIGLRTNPEKLRRAIHDRLLARLRHGMIAEVRRLHEKNGMSWQRLDDLGLEYRYVSRYLRGLLAKQEMIAALEMEIQHYAKRQMTWFKRNSAIHWITDKKSADPLVEKFLAAK